MAAGLLLSSVVPMDLPRGRFRSSGCSVGASLTPRAGYKESKPKRDWVSKNDGFVRTLPIYIGGLSMLAVLFNRAVSGIAPVADASRVWESLSVVTCCRSLVIVYGGICILQVGIAEVSQPNAHEPMVVDADKLMQGSLYGGVAKSRSQSYLANLSLYPGKSELSFLPFNTQAVILQPLGDKGIAIVGGDTIRGFTASDQSWIALIGAKLDADFAKVIGKPPLVVRENS